MYYNKYLKYKNKYLKLLGGTLDENNINIMEWTKIVNKGQNNCGIYINNSTNKLIKCTHHKHNEIKFEYANLLNKYFPIIYSIEYNEDLDKTFTTMELLDGDITSIFFNILPKIALNKTLDECKHILLENEHNIDLPNYEKKDLIYRIFKLKTPTTYIDPRNDPYIEFSNYISELNKIKLIEYNEFIEKIKLLINIFYNFITIEIMKLLYILNELGYEYIDYKFDNFAYKLLNDDQIHDRIDHYKCEKKFLNKNVFLYIIDYESGLYKIENPSDIKNIETFNLHNSVNGQYSINNINNPIQYLNEPKHITFSSDIKEIFDTFYVNCTKEQFEMINRQLI